MKKNKEVLRMIIAALCLALAYVLPFLTGQIPEIGSMLCPMHLPILICGFLCGWKYGLMVGFCAPLLRSAILGMPPMYPTALCMAFELATYGVVAALMHKMLPKKKPYVYVSLLTSMVVGRIVWGIAMYIFTAIKGGSFTFNAFMLGAFTNALPGIILQIVLVPIIVMILENPKVLDLSE